MSKVIEHIISQHAEEVAFLWTQRNTAVSEPHYSCSDLCALDQRLDANIDGLLIAGDAGWEMCCRALDTSGAGEIFAAAILAFCTERQDRIERVIELGCESEAFARPVISALGWLGSDRVAPFIQQLLASAAPLKRFLGIGASAVVRKDPGPVLLQSIADREPRLRNRGLKAVGELGLHSLLSVLGEYTRSDTAEVEFWAAWSTALLGDPQGACALWDAAHTASADSRNAAILAVRRAEMTVAYKWFDQCRSRGDNRLAIIVAGAMGDPILITWLIDQMEAPQLARIAGEALSMITGVDLKVESLDAKMEIDSGAGPTDDPDDQNIDLDPDENLPWPDHRLVQTWWQKSRDRFQPGGRYLAGEPVTASGCRHVLRFGYQRQRAAAAIELMIQEAGTPLINVKAPGFRQSRSLGV